MGLVEIGKDPEDCPFQCGIVRGVKTIEIESTLISNKTKKGHQ